MLVIMYRFYDHLSFYLLEVIVHFQRANPGDVVLTFVILPNYFYQCGYWAWLNLLFLSLLDGPGQQIQ